MFVSSKRNSCKLSSIILLACFALQCAALKYDPSKTYSYSYSTDILLNDANSKQGTRPQKDVGAKLDVKFQVSTIYKDDEIQLFKLQITEARVSSAVRPDASGRPITGSISTPAYFELTGDVVGSLRFAESDNTFSRNVKKGIVSLFQVQDKEGTRIEIDVSGECDVKYSIPKAGTVERIKTNCKNVEIANDFSTSNKALGVSVYTQSSQSYTLKDGVIDSVKGSQRVITYLNIMTTLNGGLTSTQNVQLMSTSGGPSQASSLDDALTLITTEFRSAPALSLLPSEEEIQQCSAEGCRPPKDLAKNLNDDLLPENLASVKSAKAFIQLLKSFRSSGKKTIADLLSSGDSYYIVSQLIDVATAAQTEATRAAILDLMDFDSQEPSGHPQRFLFAATYSSHPSVLLISDLLSVLRKPIPSDSLRESLLLSLGAVIHTFCQEPEQCGQPVVEEFKALIVERLSACTEESCKLMYLRALGNAGLPGTLPIITSFLESPGSPMLTSTTITCLRRIPSRYINRQVKGILTRIFNQNKSSYDSSVRVAALEMLLKHKPSQNLIRNALLVALDQTNPEFSTYVLRALKDSATTNGHVREHLQAIAKDSRLNNYNIHSQKGKSSVVSSYLAKMTDLNATYNLFFENSASGVMKRSGMIVNLLGKTIEQPFMKFGIYADGLESLVGESEDTSSDDEEGSAGTEPNSGMSFYFMDVLLSQVEFFRGTSGLMSAVWSAPSELTSALQGNLLLQDHSLLVHLSNGLVVDSKVYGALSIDLSGYVSISLWNRNCEALIRNSGAMYVEGSLAVKNREFNIGLSFTGEAQSNIDYTSNADFYEMPLKLCMQMMRPELNFLQMTHKHESIRKMKKYRSKCSSSTKVSGESYLLNESNSKECRLMMKED